MRPVQSAAVGGSHTSNLISESNDGLAVPCTRQNGTLTAAPPIVVGAVTIVADVMLDASGVTDAKLAQLKAAWLAPDAAASPSASANPMLPLLVTCMIPPMIGRMGPLRRRPACKIAVSSLPIDLRY